MISGTFHIKFPLVVLVLICLMQGSQSVQAHNMTASQIKQEQKQTDTSDPYILFEDDFDDGDADGWNVWGVGTWYVDNGEYVVDMGSGQYRQGISWIDHAEWENYILELDIKSDMGIDKNIIFRTYKSGDLFYGYWVNLVSEVNHVLLGRSYDTLYWVNYTNTIGQWYHVKIVVFNSQIKVYVNDELLIAYADDVYLSGFIGLYGWTGAYGSDIVRYDNVVVRAFKPLYLPLIIK